MASIFYSPPKDGEREHTRQNVGVQHVRFALKVNSRNLDTAANLLIRQLARLILVPSDYSSFFRTRNTALDRSFVRWDPVAPPQLARNAPVANIF